MKTYSEFQEMTKRYNKHFKRCNVSANTLYTLQNHYAIIETVTRYENRKQVEQIKKEVNAEYYANGISAIGFFKDRITKSYCSIGFIMSALSCKNPNGNETIKREYEFIYRG